MEIYGMEIPVELINIVRTKEPLDQYEYLEKVYPDLIYIVSREEKEEK